jgi:2-methylcitrate dehydratase PrpD
VKDVTEELADFVVGIKERDLDPSLIDRALLATIDTLAAAAGGVSTANASAMRASALPLFGSGDFPTWFARGSAGLCGAILANCAAASALDVDDGHRGAAGHPGAAIIPAVLTAAACENWSGREILTAILLGYDVALRIASARQPDPYISYASGRWCGYGVAAALGRLYGLSRGELKHALAITGAEAPQSLPQGASRDMASVKGSSPWATLTATCAIERARRGATGPGDILDMSAAYDRHRILSGLGDIWLINSTYLKPYASCRYTHPAIDAVLHLIDGFNLPATSSIDVTVEIFPEARKIPNDRRPTTLEAAQFSIPFCVALAIVGGAEAFRPMRENWLRDERVLELSQRVGLVFSERFAGQFPERTPARVEMREQGRIRDCAVEYPLGDVANPLSRPDIDAKLFDLAKGVLSPEAAARLIQSADDMRDGSAVPFLRELARPSLEFSNFAA